MAEPTTKKLGFKKVGTTGGSLGIIQPAPAPTPDDEKKSASGK